MKTKIDWKDIGLRVGIELHSEIESNKLFCSCPSILRNDEPDIKIKRFLRTVSSEIGEKDIVAEYEMSKNKYVIYEAYRDTTCLVELDEEPIHLINKDALEVVLQVCKILNMKFIDELQIMRKQVLDGSAVSGFQRSINVARNGFIETKYGKVGIETVCIEEDAARKISEDDKSITYRLDRLGISLIEIATEPNMNNPEQVKEVAAYIGMILRSTGRFRRGIGTIRQDLNVSIKGHDRVEIKGVQDLRLIPRIVELEVRRQLENLKNNKSKGEVRKANPDGTTEFLRPLPGAARLYVETDIPSVKITKNILDSIKIPELLSERALKYERKYNISAELAREIVGDGRFEKYANKYHVDPNFIARLLVEIPKDISSRYNLDVDKIKESDFEFVLDNISRNIIPKSAAVEILKDICEGKKVDVNKYRIISADDVEKEIGKIIENNKGLTFNAYMGLAMEKFRGKVEGKIIADIIKKKLR